MSSYDSAWKEVLDRFLRALLLLLFPEVESEIDWAEDYESLDPQLRKMSPEGEVGDRLADKLIKAKASGSGDPRVLHFEVQGKKQHEFQRRVYRYHYRAFDGLDLPPESLIILADEDPDWRPTRFEVVLKRTKLTFEFVPIKLLDWVPRKEELRHHENPMGLFVLAHLEALRTRANDEERARVKLDLLLELARRKLDDEDTRQWYRLLDWLLNLPTEIDTRVYREAQAKLQEGTMPYVSFADRYERQNGRTEGITEGKREGLLAGIEAVLDLRFGAPGLGLMADVKKIESPDRLSVILTEAKRVNGLDEMRKLLTPSNGSPPPDKPTPLSPPERTSDTENES